MKIKTMDPNEHNTQRIENEAIKTNRTVEHLWDVLVFDVAFLFWVFSILGSSLILRFTKNKILVIFLFEVIFSFREPLNQKMGKILPEI